MIIRSVGNHGYVLHSISRHYSEIMDTHQMERVFHNINVKNVHTLKHSILNIRKSATNIFITFSVNNIVLFSSSAGSAGSEKRARRVNLAIKALCDSFERFIRYHLRTSETVSIFNNITVHINAPIQICKSFIYRIRSFLRKVSIDKNMDVLLKRHNESISYQRKLKTSKRNRKTRKQQLLSNTNSRSVSGAKLVNSEYHVIRLGNVCVSRSNSIRVYSCLFFNVSTDHNSFSFLHNMSGMSVPQGKRSSELVCKYTIYIFRRFFIDRDVVHPVRGTYNKQCYIGANICSSLQPAMTLYKRSLYVDTIVANCVRYYASLRYINICSICIPIFARTVRSRVKLNRLRRIVVFSIHKDSYVACQLSPLRDMNHAFQSYGMYTYFNIRIMCASYKKKPILRVAIYCITKYAQILGEIFVFFLTMCSTQCIHDLSTFVPLEAICVHFITICSAVLVPGAITPVYSTTHNIIPHMRKVLNNKLSVSYNSLLISRYVARNIVVRHGISNKQTPKQIMWSIIYKKRVRRIRRSLRQIIKKRSINIRCSKQQKTRAVLSDRLCMFRIVCLVNKSTKPFNGCRSSARLS
jgi:hypothetical protein